MEKKEQKRVNVPLYHIEDLIFPFVEGQFKNKNGEIKSGYFLLDSGSRENILNSTVLSQLTDEAVSGQSINISAFAGKGEQCRIVNLEMSIDKEHSCEQFCVSYAIDFTKLFGENRIIGIIGAKYMHKHKMALDFEQKCLRSAEGDMIELDNKTFLFPMGYGLRSYGIPLIGIIKEDGEFLCVADSGANINTITECAMKKCASHYQMEDEEGVLESISGSMIAAFATMEFDLLNVVREGETNLVSEKGRFQILQNDEFVTISNNKDIPPISALIGSEFMLSHKWVLDFANEVIYSNAS